MTTFNYLVDYSVSSPAGFAREMVTTTAAMRSPLTGAIQTTDRAGSRWRLRCEWVVKGAERDELEAMLAALNGQEHRLALPMFDHYTGKANRGAWSGTPVIDGAAQTGYDLNISGAPASVTGYAAKGDFLAFGDGVRIVTADANSDGAGDVALSIWPAIRSSPANGAPIDASSDATGVYFLVEASETQISDELASGDYLSRIGATFEEDVLA